MNLLFVTGMATLNHLKAKFKLELFLKQWYPGEKLKLGC